MRLKSKKYVWCANKSDDFAQHFRSDETRNLKTCLNEAEEMIDNDVNFSIQKFNERLLYSWIMHEENCCYW